MQQEKAFTDFRKAKATENKTKLQIWVYDNSVNGLTMTLLANVIGAKTPKTVRDKLYKRVAFTLPEMRAIKEQLLPEYELEEIFEGY